MSNNITSSEDLELARQVRALDREIQPTRDLWQGIERRIIDYPQKSDRQHEWMPYGVAASMLLAACALVLNLLPGQNTPITASQGIDLMEAEYVQVRNPMVQRFNEVNKDLDQQTLNDLYRNLKILEEARLEIEAQVREQPDNQRLVELLMKIHQQELELLKQDFSRPSRMM